MGTVKRGKKKCFTQIYKKVRKALKSQVHSLVTFRPSLAIIRKMGTPVLNHGLSTLPLKKE
jgi:hypothetical protein